MSDVRSDASRAPRVVRLSGAAIVVLVVGALAITVGIGVVRSSLAAGEAEAAAVPAVAVSAAPSPSPYVYVTGAVVSPGLVTLRPGDRLAAAIDAAGGFTDDADRAAVNLARVVVDGEQLHVPLVGEAPTDGGAVGGGSGAVSINNASAVDLEALPRVGPAIAQRIVEWREEHGPFRAIEDLLNVPGIGDSVLEEIRELVTL